MFDNKTIALTGLIGLGLFFALKSKASNIPSFTTSQLISQTNDDGSINLDPGFNFATDTDTPDSITYENDPWTIGTPANANDPLTIGTPYVPDYVLSAWNYDTEMWGMQKTVATQAVFGIPESNIIMQTVSELIADIADYLVPIEGFRSFVYDDANGKPWNISKIGNPTIGYGHKLKSGESVDWVITSDQAYALLIQDISDHLIPIIPNVIVPLTLNQWIVVTSLAFNAGSTAVLRSRFLQALNLGDLASAEYEFKDWNKATITVDGVKVKRVVAGLVTRRENEWNLFVAPQQVVLLDSNLYA